MASRWSNQLRIGRAVGQLIRVFLAGLVATLTFVSMLSIGNRGFLPSMQRMVWIEGRLDANAWTFRVLGDGPVEYTPPPDSAGAWLLGLQESSMGRVNGPAWQWRCHTWIPVVAINPNSDPVDWTRESQLRTVEFQTPFDEFVRTQVIPSSKALAIWPDTPTDTEQYSSDPQFPSWSVRQHRSRPWLLVPIAALALALGLGVALIINPTWGSTPEPPAR